MILESPLVEYLRKSYFNTPLQHDCMPLLQLLDTKAGLFSGLPYDKKARSFSTLSHIQSSLLTLCLLNTKPLFSGRNKSPHRIRGDMA